MGCLGRDKWQHLVHDEFVVPLPVLCRAVAYAQEDVRTHAAEEWTFYLLFYVSLIGFVVCVCVCVLAVCPKSKLKFRHARIVGRKQVAG